MVTPGTTTELDAVRAEIERIDGELVRAIAERMRLARRIGRIKQEAGMTLVHPAREAAVVRRAGELARERGLDEEAVRGIFWRLIEMSRTAQAQGEGSPANDIGNSADCGPHVPPQS